VVLVVGGLELQKSLPEADPINFLPGIKQPGIKQPVLMLDGKNDFLFPYETSQMSFFKLLGTAEKDKKIIIYNGGHSVPVTDQARETLIWLEVYFGTVARK